MTKAVIIGHGRSPEARHWGPKIDRCDCVIRMWDWDWQVFPDYGQKYTYGVLALTPKQLQIFEQYNRCTPDGRWLFLMGKRTGGDLPDKVTLVDCDPYTRLAQTRFCGRGLTGKLTLTRGTLAALWALDQLLSSDQLILVGFDNVYYRTNMPVEEAFPPIYWRIFNDRFPNQHDKVYPVGPQTATHDMRIERSVLEFAANERRVDLKFAQETW